MNINNQPYQISTEYDLSNIIAKFDSNYIYDVLEDKLDNISFSKSLIEPNIINAFESNFKTMNEMYPGDSQNIQNVRQETYLNIIAVLTSRFNLQFNTIDPNIDYYTAAFYLYDFLVCNRNNIMINFFTSFIINNRQSLMNMINMEDFRKSKDSAAAYGKRVYVDQQYAIISANINNIINYIITLDISLSNIFQITYKDPRIIQFLDNAFADKGNFFKDFYCKSLQNIEELPIIITNIRLALQNQVGDTSTTNIQDYLNLVGGNENE